MFTENGDSSARFNEAPPLLVCDSNSVKRVYRNPKGAILYLFKLVEAGSVERHCDRAILFGKKNSLRYVCFYFPSYLAIHSSAMHFHAIMRRLTNVKC